MRHRRVWIVAVVAWSLAFAQAAMAAHACALSNPGASSLNASEPHAPAAHPGCAHMGGHSGSAINACGAHCLADQQTQAHAQVPTAAIAPQSALLVRLDEGLAIAGRTASFRGWPSAAPPPQLLYSRFLS